MSSYRSPTTRNAVKTYQETIRIFDNIAFDVKELTKKKPESIISKFKVTQINRILNDIKAFLKEEPEYKYLDTLDEETLPQMADASIIIAQFKGALEAFYQRHRKSDGNYGTKWWTLEDDEESEEGEDNDADEDIEDEED